MNTNKHNNGYGVLLTFSDAAKILHRSQNGLRVSLTTKDPKFSELNRIKVKMGRRVYFPAKDFFEIVLKA